MSGLFVDLSDYEVMEKLNELQVDFFVEADEEDSSFFKGFVNLPTITGIIYNRRKCSSWDSC